MPTKPDTHRRAQGAHILDVGEWILIAPDRAEVAEQRTLDVEFLREPQRELHLGGSDIELGAAERIIGRDIARANTADFKTPKLVTAQEKTLRNPNLVVELRQDARRRLQASDKRRAEQGFVDPATKPRS